MRVEPLTSSTRSWSTSWSTPATRCPTAAASRSRPATSIFDEPYALEHFDVEPGAYVMLAVSDTGTGMDREIRAAHLRAVLHDQGAGQGHGAGAGHGLRHRRARPAATSGSTRSPGLGTSFKNLLPSSWTCHWVRTARSAPRMTTAYPRSLGADRGGRPVSPRLTSRSCAAARPRRLARAPGAALEASSRRPAARRAGLRRRPAGMSAWSSPERVMDQHPHVRFVLLSGYTPESLDLGARSRAGSLRGQNDLVATTSRTLSKTDRPGMIPARALRDDRPPAERCPPAPDSPSGSVQPRRGQPVPGFRDCQRNSVVSRLPGASATPARGGRPRGLRARRRRWRSQEPVGDAVGEAALLRRPGRRAAVAGTRLVEGRRQIEAHVRAGSTCSTRRRPKNSSWLPPMTIGTIGAPDRRPT